MITRTRKKTGMPSKRLARSVAAAATVTLLGLVTMAGAGAQTTDQPIASGDLSGFDSVAVAGVMDFQVSYPDAFAYRVAGGVLESSTLASGSGNAAGIAGPMPVPLLYQGGAVFPPNDPVTGTPIPEDVRNGWTSIDFQSMPNQCKSEYPDIYDKGNDERYCGGPASDNPAMGFTAALANGHSKSSGDTHNPLKTKAVSTSRGTDVFVPSLQTKIHSAWSETTSGVNGEGLPQSKSVVDLDGVSILNGLINLNEMRSEAVAVSDGTEAGTTTSSSFSLGSATVAGIPVVIGREGVSVRKEALVPGKSVQEAAKQVSDALKAADVNIRLVPAPGAEKLGTEVSTWSAGVEIDHRGSSVRPSNSFYRFGYVSASVSATRSEGDSGGTSESPVLGTPGAGGVPYHSGSSSTSADTGAYSSDASGGATSVAGNQAFGEPSTPDLNLGTSGGDPGTAGAGEVAAATEGGGASTTRLRSPSTRRVLLAQPLASYEVKNVASYLLALAVVAAAALPLRRVLRALR